MRCPVQVLSARDLGVVDEATRMTNLVVRIEDPYSVNSEAPVLKFGNYVEISFNGKVLRDVFKIKQDLVNNKIVWTLDKDGKLVSRTVNVVREQGDFFLIDSGLENGEQIVLTPPEYPHTGMEVIVIDENSNSITGAAE